MPLPTTKGHSISHPQRVSASDSIPADSDTEKQTRAPATSPPPPNGGVVAWLQVAGAFFLFFNSW